MPCAPSMKTPSLWARFPSFGLTFPCLQTFVVACGTHHASIQLVTSNQLTGTTIIGPSTPLVSISTLPSWPKGGCIIVDSTRKGKRFPDSMSKTIPIWTCVLNRAIQSYRNMMHENGSVKHMDKNFSHADDETGKEAVIDWDCSLHLPLWVSKTEKASIENHLEEFTARLEESGADIASLAASLRKPLRPLWISQKSVIWLNEVPDHDSWDFTPIILVSASSPNGFCPQRTSSEFSWNYIPGAGDDEESWARGLTPILFWNHVYDLINCGPDLCNQKVSEIVEKDRVYRAQRGEDAPQILVKPQKSSGSNGYPELPLHSDFENIKIGESSPPKGDSGVCWLGSTKIAVGTTQLAASAPDVDCILNCDEELPKVDPSYAYLHLPSLSSKFDRFSLINNLPSAVQFARANLIQGKSLLVCCHDGEDISVCICLAILISLFNEEGVFLSFTAIRCNMILMLGNEGLSKFFQPNNFITSSI